MAQHTKREITQIVGAPDVEGQSALLVNAVYFKGGWDNVFDKGATKPAPFHLASGAVASVPMMNGLREHAFVEGTSFQGVRLPYKNTTCALWALLPRPGQSPAQVLLELGQTRQLRARSSARVSLPRFEIKWHANLTPDLSKLNAPLPFSPDADFSAMGQPTAGISAVIHVAKMRVDEEGTVAAAATVVAMAGAAAPAPQEPKRIVFDRPFVVALVEETSGARLFEGTVYDPKRSE